MERSRVTFDKNSQAGKERRTKVLFVVLLGFLILVVAMVAFMRRPEFQITEVTVTGIKSLDPAMVISVAHTAMAGNYLAIIPKTNAILFSKSRTESFLKNQIPTISQVQVSFTKRNTLSISIIEKKPTVVWCNTSDCYFVDRGGMLYEIAPRFSDGVFVTFTGTTISHYVGLVGSRFVSPDQFLKLTLMISDLKQYPLDVLAVDLRDTGDIAIRFDTIKKINVNPNAYLLFAKDTLTQEALQTLDVIMSDRTFLETLKLKGNLLEYIDVRIPGKVYYKFINTVAAPVQP